MQKYLRFDLATSNNHREKKRQFRYLSIVKLLGVFAFSIMVFIAGYCQGLLEKSSPSARLSFFYEMPKKPLLDNSCKEKFVEGQRASSFESIYDTSYWISEPNKKGKSRSGPGSDPENNLANIVELSKFIRERNLTSFADVPCGDFSWQNIIPQVANGEVLYYGGDIASSVVHDLQRKYQFDNSKVFQFIDMVECRVPKYSFDKGKTWHSFDVVHAKHVLQHLPLKDGLRFVRNIVRSGAKYFVVTTFPGHNNCDGTNLTFGEFYHNDLESWPYKLHNDIVYRHRGYGSDHVVFWKITDRMKKIVDGYKSFLENNLCGVKP